jgi:hypothetical protein
MKIRELIVMNPYLFAHGLGEQVHIRQREIVTIVEENAFEGVDECVVIDIDAAVVDNADLSRGLGNSIIDRFGEGGMDEVEIEVDGVFLIHLELQLKNAASVKYDLLLAKCHVEAKLILAYCSV